MSAQLQANRQTPAQWALIGLGILAAGLFLAVPLVFIFIQAFQKGIAPVLENLVHPELIHAVALTVFIALITVPVNMIFGVMLAWVVTRFSFPGKTALLSCIDIPFAVSPVVAGLVYLLWYGANGPLAPWLDAAQVQILFAWPGMVLVTIFVTCPFVARELIPLMTRSFRSPSGVERRRGGAFVGCVALADVLSCDAAQNFRRAPLRSAPHQCARDRRIRRGFCRLRIRAG